MQLLYSRASPCPEFASLSLLLKGDISGDQVSCRLGEPLLLPSSVSTISHTSCIATLKELHYYINSIYKAKSSSNQSNTTSLSGDLFSEDEKVLLLSNEMQVFRPLQGHGLGLHYRLIRDRSTMSKFIPFIMNASKSTASSSSSTSSNNNKGKILENEVTGVILCVGISGLPSTLAMSALHYSLPQRMRDCIDILSSTGTDVDPISSRALLATLLLTEDEDRLSNTMAEGPNRTLLSEADEMANEGGKRGKKNILGRNITKGGGHETAHTTDIIDPLLLNSADLARIMVERLAVLSVSESDTIFRKYEAKANAEEKAAAKSGGSTRRRKGGRDADLDGFDFKGSSNNGTSSGSGGNGPSPLASTLNHSGMTSGGGGGGMSGIGRGGGDFGNGGDGSGGGRMGTSSGFGGSSTTNSVTGGGVSLSSSSSQRSGGGGGGSKLKQPKNDTSSRSNKGGKVGAPLLMASSKDNIGRSRRASMDTSGAGRPQKRNSNSNGGMMDPSSQPMVSSDWNFGSGGGGGGSGFPGDGDVSVTSGRTGASGGTSSSSRGGGGRHRHGDPTRHQSTGSTTSAGGSGFDPFAMSHSSDMMDGTSSHLGHPAEDLHQNPPQFDNDDNMMNMMSSGSRSSRSLGDGSQGTNNGSPRIQVNVALNEDLTCFYKLSKMSSCSVEGVLQVQVKSTAPQGVPFSLLVRDPSKHIQSLQENKKFVESMGDNDPNNPDQRFTVSVPKADNYFPIMRYKCGNELRPVPIRVQTRVRLEDDHWRVALQISSNPHNEDNLTDLTIIMGVPPVVRGESLTTSPPGGVWNASKRSVIWCVSELGGGEKFQLQARFEVEPEEAGSTSEKPKFPVLVRCQCMYAQLSDVEVEVSDIPEVFSADVRMKLARRFRLSHRERP